MLVRVRIPGGLLGASALAALARASLQFGDGRLDFTARASVQLRGVRTDGLSVLGEVLDAAGLLPSRAHDRVRNVIASPFAGVDPDELLDPRPLVSALDAALVADPMLAALPVKFAFAVDGGGRPFPVSRPDIALCAVASADGAQVHFVLDGAPTGIGTTPESAPSLALAVARAALAAAAVHDVADTWRLASAPRIRQTALAALHACSSALRMVQHAPVPLRSNGIAVPLGRLAAREHDRQNVVPSVPLGRLTAAQGMEVAQVAASVGADVRLGWWRGLVLADVPCAAAGDVVTALAQLGLPCDRRDGFVGIAACAGSAGCDAALADVRRDAVDLASRLAGCETAGWSANFAGCEKRCAMRRGASVDVVATPEGYDLYRAGRRVRTHASSADALAFAHVCANEDSVLVGSPPKFPV
ncbi:MAG: precorrin-3B synthase [Candidatus Elarobacter sp.]